MIRRALLIAILLIPTLGEASPFEIASDITLPFRLTLQGAGASSRENTKLGLEFRHTVSEATQWGVRFDMDLEEYQGAFRKMGVGPFVTGHWMEHETWHPFARFELPYIWKGAPNNHGDSSQLDLGLGGGVGIAWHLEDNPVSIYYNFGFHYFFGIGDALSTISIDLFRIGVSYRF